MAASSTRVLLALCLALGSLTNADPGATAVPPRAQDGVITEHQDCTKWRANGSETVLAWFYRTRHPAQGEIPPPEQHVLFSDGTLIWRVSDGPAQYRIAKIGADALAALIARLNAIDANTLHGQFSATPSSPDDTVGFVRGDRRVTATWDGRASNALTADPIRFRAAFDAVRSVIKDARHEAEATPVVILGDIDTKAVERFWSSCL